MGEIKTGGPAFPHQFELIGDDNPCPRWTEATGLTVRDWFAGQALAGMLSSPAIFPKTPTDWHNEYSRDAYRVADSMLAAREGGSNAD